MVRLRSGLGAVVLLACACSADERREPEHGSSSSLAAAPLTTPAVQAGPSPARPPQSSSASQTSTRASPAVDAGSAPSAASAPSIGPPDCSAYGPSAVPMPREKLNAIALAHADRQHAKEAGSPVKAAGHAHQYGNTIVIPVTFQRLVDANAEVTVDVCTGKVLRSHMVFGY